MAGEPPKLVLAREQKTRDMLGVVENRESQTEVCEEILNEIY